jgi:uncharacterized protein (TIGR03066 family)
MKMHHLILAVLFASCAVAKETAIDKDLIVGHWRLIAVKADDEKVKTKALAGRKEFEFRKDGTMQNVCSPRKEDVSPVSGTYRVEAGQVFVKIGKGEEDPAKAIIRDGCLVIIPPNGPVSELIFERF